MTLFALPLVPFFLRPFFNFFAFLNRSFSYLRHCCIFVFRWRSFSFLRRCYLIVFRSSTIFRQFSPTFFAFSGVLCLSYLSSLISLSLSVVLSRTYVKAGYLSFALFPCLSYVIAVLLSFVRPLYFVNSLRLCFLSLSFLSMLRQFFNFFVFLNRSFSYLRHCCIFVFRCRSFTFLRHCCLIVFRSSTVFRQFSTTLFTFLCRSFSFSC